MTVAFSKDLWIKASIAKRYLIPMKDGRIMRANKASGMLVDADRGYHEIKFRTHPRTGRVYFNLTWMGVKKSVLVNRVIALAFLQNPKGLPQVNHIDGNKEHNALVNLEWCTGSENEKHAHQTGLKTGRGSSNSNSRLTAADVEFIRSSSLSNAELAQKYGVAVSTIYNVRAGRTWTHI